MARPDPRNENELNQWFAEIPARDRCILTSRSALRVASTIRITDPLLFPAIILPLFRTLLTSAVYGAGYSDGFDADKIVSISFRGKEAWSCEGAQAAICSAQSIDAADAASSSISASANAAANAASIEALQTAQHIRRTFLKDIDSLVLHGKPKALWHHESIPTTIHNSHNELSDWLEKINELQFFRAWYLGMWDGTWADWGLAHEVAKIDDSIWEAGQEAVAARIGEIEARHALEKEVSDLKAQLKQTQTISPSPNRHHNNPPPDALIEIEQSVSKEIVLIWEQLEQVEEEIAKTSPDPSTLRKIAQVLWDISARIAVYFGSLADTALQESAKAVGKTGTQAGIAVLASTTAAQNEGVKAVAKAIWEFVKTLPSG